MLKTSSIVNRRTCSDVECTELKGTVHPGGRIETFAGGAAQTNNCNTHDCPGKNDYSKQRMSILFFQLTQRQENGPHGTATKNASVIGKLSKVIRGIRDQDQELAKILNT